MYDIILYAILNMNSLLSPVFVTMLCYHNKLFLFNSLIHCFLTLTLCKTRGKEFRTEYGELNKVRAFLMDGVPFMAVTGTATLAMVKEITQMLEMHEFVTVKATSNRPNIMYTVQKMETVPYEEVEKKE